MIKTKYIFVILEVRNGGYKYNSHSVNEVSIRRTPNRVGEECAKNYYDSRPFKYSLNDEWYNFFGGEIAVRLIKAEEITREEYVVLNKFQRK